MRVLYLQPREHYCSYTARMAGNDVGASTIGALITRLDYNWERWGLGWGSADAQLRIVGCWAELYRCAAVVHRLLVVGFQESFSGQSQLAL